MTALSYLTQLVLRVKARWLFRVPAIQLGDDTDGPATSTVAPTVYSCTGAPTLTCAAGSIAVRRDLSSNALNGIYLRANGAWVDVLQDLYDLATSASSDTFTDTHSFYPTDTVGAAFDKLALDIASKPASAVTIASGVVTATQSLHTIDTEAAASSDDVDTINGLDDGQIGLFSIVNNARNVVLKHGTGNLHCELARDITLDVTTDTVIAIRRGATVYVRPFNIAAFSGGGMGSALASNANGLGAALVGFETGTLPGDPANVQAAIVSLAGQFANVLNVADVVAATVAVADASGGATDAALTLALVSKATGDPITSARRVLIRTGAAQYAPAQDLNANVTFGTATTGSIVASGNGWAIVETDGNGDFACTASNSTDETVYFWVESVHASATPGTASMVAESNSDAAAWSA